MIRAALTNPYLIVVSCLAVTVMGLFTYTKIPADLLPQFDSSAVQIVCFYPGMPPEVMEKDIMSRLQRWTGQSIGIEHQEAKAMQGVCVVKDFFREGIPMADAMSQVSSYAMSDMFYLPPGTIPPMVMPFDPTASVPLCLVVVSNPQMSEQELYDIAYYELRNKLQSIQGVIAPAVYGGKLRRVLAYVDPAKLEAHGLSPMDVQQALLKQNVLIPAGSIKVGQQELQILTNANVETWEELNDAPIKQVPGQAPVRMRDVGYVDGKAAQIQTNVVRVNGSRKAYIPIYRQPGANTIAIVRQIKRQLRDIETRLKVEQSNDPKMDSLVLTVAMDQSIGVEQANHSLQLAAGLGAVLAGVVVLIFLRSIRFTVVIVLAIPLAILTAIFGMFFTNDSFNAMTLGGLALAIGILVDQSIVVLENIVRHAQMGKTAKEAAMDGTKEVAGPMFIATLTFAIVFFPVVFLSGLAKFLFTPLAVAASIAIFASYVLAITLVPAYCARFLNVRTTDDKRRETSLKSGIFARTYQTVLRSLLRLRYLVVLFAAAAFVLAGLLMNRYLGQELFPKVDSGQMSIFIRMPTGTRIEETESTIAKIESEIINLIGAPDPGFAVGIEQNPESNLQIIVSNIGVLMDWPAAYTPNTGSMDTFMLVQTKSKPGSPDIFEYVQTMRNDLRKKFPNAEFAFDTGGMLTAALNMGEPAPIHFQINSANLETGQTVAKQIVAAANAVPGTADVRIAQRTDYPILQVDMDRDLASRLGLNPDEVMKNLVAATNSSVNFQPAFWIDKDKGNHYFLGVQYTEDVLNSIDTIRSIPVGSDNEGRPLKLGNIAEIHRTTGPGIVNHVNISRVTDVFANVKQGFDIGSVVTAIENKLIELGAKEEEDERGKIYRLGTRSINLVLDRLQLSDSVREKAVRIFEDDSNIQDFTSLLSPEQKNQWDQMKAEVLADASLFEGVSFRMRGEVRSMREAFKQFSSGFLIAVILVYLVMVAQFRSFTDPLIVLLTVPLGFIGVVLMLYFTDTNLSIMAFMGIIMMVGIVVEYSIILVDFANRHFAEHGSAKDAILEAASVRLRPILMTSFTTWLALLPMAIGFGGSEANAPLARAIIGGVVGATLLSLLVVPCLYMIFKRQPGKTVV
ncbi:MAG: efflux RND transporter permease subunit [Planctomycetota bacterium]|nr:efflux RND transporter permease subunit [Planctomycetota bacterium]